MKIPASQAMLFHRLASTGPPRGASTFSIAPMRTRWAGT